MLSVVIATENAERALLPTLVALVGGATAGLVSEVIVADAGSTDATAVVAEAAGCRIVATRAPLADRLREAAAQARAPWLLFLRPGVVPDSTWIEETRRFIQMAQLSGRANARAALFRAPTTANTLGASILQKLARMAAALRLRSPQQRGLLIAKELYAELGGHRGDAEDPEANLLRRLGRRRLVWLRSQIMLAGEQLL
jgi:glycosyltransferase involved in cell wall biosynthesis